MLGPVLLLTSLLRSGLLVYVSAKLLTSVLIISIHHLDAGACVMPLAEHADPFVCRGSSRISGLACTVLFHLQKLHSASLALLILLPKLTSCFWRCKHARVLWDTSCML